jgi:sulfatase maturation enzyme AslB (radical SAM superfamily)
MEQMYLDNEELTKNFLQRQFFDGWKNRRFKSEEKYQNSKSLELQVSGACDLDCKYCYYSRYSKDLYPLDIAKKSLVLNNLDLVLNWLEKNSYFPIIELFSGEIFAISYGIDVVKKVVDWQIKNGIDNNLTIPTNFSFIFDDKKISEIENLFEHAKQHGIRIGLSCSVDGKYSDVNRPFISGKVRDDAYYDKLFAFCKKWSFSFHPMIYSNKIEDWIKNFLWFQDNFKKHDIPFDALYLLEVRNEEWNKIQIKEYYKLIRFIVNWISKILVYNSPDDFANLVSKAKLFNIFSLFSTVGRGLGCSMQSTPQLRLGDLTASVCHRAAYKQHNLWKFKVDNNEIIGIENLNHNLLITAFSLDFRSMPMCEFCPIRELCSGQCLGSMFESSRDLFAPIPTVCALEHAKAAAIIDELHDLRLLEGFYPRIASIKEKSILNYLKYFRGIK